MKYEKPEIAPLASALSAIECSGAKDSNHADCREEPSPAAYEADE